jgi:cold shock CspA family protein
MGRSQESYNKKEVRNKKEKKRKEKAQKRVARKDQDKSSFDDMIAYVDEHGNITSTPPDPSKKEIIDPDTIELGIPKMEDVEPESKLRRGVVTFFNQSKGFGFIRDMQTKQSVFVHINNLREPIAENNIVMFEMGRGPKGPMAMDVQVHRG